MLCTDVIDGKTLDRMTYCSHFLAGSPWLTGTATSPVLFKWTNKQLASAHWWYEPDLSIHVSWLLHCKLCTHYYNSQWTWCPTFSWAVEPTCSTCTQLGGASFQQHTLQPWCQSFQYTAIYSPFIWQYLPPCTATFPSHGKTSPHAPVACVGLKLSGGTSSHR